MMKQRPWHVPAGLAVTLTVCLGLVTPPVFSASAATSARLTVTTERDVSPSGASHVVVFGATWKGLLERSVDGGPWQPLFRIPEHVSGGPALVWSLSASADGQTVYAGTYTGHVWASTDGGLQWARADAGEFSTNNAVLSLTIDPRNPRVVYGGTLYGLFKTTTGGIPWLRLAGGLPYQSGSEFALDAQNPNSVWTASIESFNSQVGALYHSIDGGTTWSAVTGGGAPASNLWGSLAVSQADPQLIYASANDAFYWSTDGGATWSHQSLASFTSGASIYISPVDPQRLFILIFGLSEKLYVSGAGGASWMPAQGLPGTVYTIVPDPRNAAIAYAATNVGMYRSTDGGMTWSLWVSGALVNAISVVTTTTPPAATALSS